MTDVRREGAPPGSTPGMTLEIEPIVNAGSHGVVINGDRRTVRTRDDALSANVEDAVAVTGNAPDILIRRGRRRAWRDGKREEGRA